MAKRVYLILNPIMKLGRLVIDEPLMAATYIVEPNDEDTGDETIDLENKKSIQVAIEKTEMKLRGFPEL